METVKISVTLAVEPTSAGCHYPEKGSALPSSCGQCLRFFKYSTSEPVILLHHQTQLFFVNNLTLSPAVLCLMVFLHHLLNLIVTTGSL